ncbi:hypothetical protein CSQ89_21300 [Chitinimonas sp. BJB300]|nr:hypothetical protein CSQ89_21300 [Chitinimonas sp. BJB300]TSJ82560.1 hypothetical protein FG002_022125 [Chitinimonas sp. BJB300]TSJ83895.1 hypothetical protein FG002_020420 [Chitinimonas sp. BJB300]
MASVGAEEIAIMSTALKWIKSGGGPLLCIESELLQQWLGVEGNSVANGQDNTFANDYERACSVSDYLGKTPLGDRQAMVLGDEPLETMIWRQTEQPPLIVRVYYADPDVDVIERLGTVQDLDFSDPAESMEVEFNSKDMIVFDSAYPGKDIDNMFLTFELPPGTYTVITKPFQPDDRTSVLIHIFQQK